MKVLIFWDIYWRIWRKAIKKHICELKEKYNPDFVIANWENLSSGKGPVLKNLQEISEAWVDLFTSGNHIWDNEDSIKDNMNSSRSLIIRPANFFESDYYKIPGKGYDIVERKWKKLLVINLMSWIFLHDSVYNPFLKVDEILKSIDLKGVNWIIVDFHRETTSEIYAMANFLDGRISFLYGTHTHIQTNDELIFKSWTGIISDVWMTWALYSVIWASYDSIKKRILTWTWKLRVTQDLWKEYVLNAVLVDIHENNLSCENIEKIRIRS